MKKGCKWLALFLALGMAFSCFSVPVLAQDGAFQKSAEHAAAKGIEAVLNGVLGTVDFLLPDGENFYDLDTYQSRNFLPGTGTFADAPAGFGTWKLGYAQASLVPQDYLEHAYYLGGYIMAENGMNNRVEELLDDMRVRVVALDDSTGSGTAVFAAVDCIGMTNQDICRIRAKLSEKMPDTNFSGISVFSTHCHSGIDTQGLWTNTFAKAFKNLFRSVLHLGKLETGTDPQYMAFLYDAVSDAMRSAVQQMHSGTMRYAHKDIGSAYFTNKNRKSASALMTQMHRLVFTPDDPSVPPTMIVNAAAHPDVAGLPTSDGQSSGRGISGDYIYYMDEVIRGAGYQFMFINGAIAGIYMSRGKTNNSQDFTRRVQQSARYGNTLGKIALSLTRTEQEIADDEYLSNDAVEEAERAVAQRKGNPYYLWYADWTPVRETDVPARLNMQFAQVTVPVTNAFIRIAGRLNLAAYDVLRENRNCFIRTEIGYLELGGVVRAALMPGEVCQDLVVGGTSVTAAGSFSGKAFGYATIEDLFGKDTIVFGLANDAIGYVIPDNDYCMCIAFDHYHELIGLGSQTASTIMRGFAALAQKIQES